MYLKRLETTGRKERAERLDRFTLPAFPLVYVLVVAVVLLLFGQA